MSNSVNDELQMIENPADYIHSSLFNEVYVLKDIPFEHKGTWSDKNNENFESFYSGFQNFIENLNHSELHEYTHTETLEMIIYPILKLLNWGQNNQSGGHPFIENNIFNLIGADGESVSIRPSILACQNSQDKEYIHKYQNTERVQTELENYVYLPILTGYYGCSADKKSNQYDYKKDEIGHRGDVFSNLGAEEQAMNYLNLIKKKWAIFTDGAIWRLYHAELTAADNSKYYEFNLSLFINNLRTIGNDSLGENEKLKSVAKYFYWFFSKEGLVEGSVPFINQVFNKSKTYADQLEDNLKERFVIAMTIACNGYKSVLSGKYKNTEIKKINEIAESLVFNLIFIAACESKRVLPQNTKYEEFSIHNLIKKIKDYNPNNSTEDNFEMVALRLKNTFKKEIKIDGSEIYDYLLRLNNLVQFGTGKQNNFGFEIHGFKESIIGKQEIEFFEETKIRNKDMIRLLFDVFYFEHKSKHLQIPYSNLSPAHLGSIYESFLEYQPEEIDQVMYFYKKKNKTKSTFQWKETEEPNTANSKMIFISKPGTIIYTPNNVDRKSTGSYYTPHYIVKYIVENTLGPIVKQKKPDEIYDVRACDPAMGSGHFLLEVLNYLTKAYLKVDNGKNKNTDYYFSNIKQEVLRHCIFGVDINPRAVKLAKMSLWLETAYAGKKLEKLDGQLECGNSLIDNKNMDSNAFDWKEKIFKHQDFDGFDAIVGNPPYVATKNTEFLNVLNRAKQNDMYIEFIFKSCQDLMKKDARFSMIIPDPFLIRDNGLEVRGLIKNSKNLHLSECVHLKNVFKNISVSNVIIFIRKSKFLEKNSTYFYRVETKDDLSNFKNSSIKPVNIVSSKNELFQFTKNKLLYLSYNDEEMKSIINAKNTLQDYLEIKRGEEVSKKMIISKGKNKALVGGESLSPYRVKYEKSGYINSVKKDKSWYSDPKLLLTKSSPKLICAYDNLGYIVPQSIYILKPKPGCPVDAFFFLGYLNSNLLNNYLYKFVTAYKLLMPHYEQQDLIGCPIEELNFSFSDFITVKRRLNSSKLKNNVNTMQLIEVCASISILSEKLTKLKDPPTHYLDLIETLVDKVLQKQESLELAS